MKTTGTGPAHTNSLTFEHRIQLADWLRAEASNIPNRTVAQMVQLAQEHIGRPCSATQLRAVAKAAKVEWNVKVVRGDGPRKGSYKALEARVAALEAWCADFAASIGASPPPGLPSDEEIED